MTSTLPSTSTTAPHLLQSSHHQSLPSISSTVSSAAAKTKSPDLIAAFNYYKDPGDGSLPAPSYVGKPETYEKPVETIELPVHNIRGEEEKYTLDSHGFQIVRHESGEKEFVDEEAIKEGYYKEVEDILKKA